MSGSPPPWGGIELRLERLLFRSGWPDRLVARLGWLPRLEVRRHGVVLPPEIGLPRPLRIAYASDFHAGGTTSPRLLELACRTLAEARPDLLLLGGDFVGTEAEAVRPLARALGGVPAPLGRYAVLGNHDWWADADTVVRALTDAGIELLTNRNVRLPAPFDGVHLCGLDDPWAGRPDARAAFAGADGTRIVIMHQPSGLLDVGPEPFALALCGHTHGGQIALPGGRPIVVAHGPLSQRYSRGRYDLAGGGVLIVSAGIGCSTLPFRLFSPPEVLLCELTPGDGSAPQPAPEPS